MSVFDLVLMVGIPLVWWEIISHFYSCPVDADTGEPVRPPLSMTQWYFYPCYGENE